MSLGDGRGDFLYPSLYPSLGDGLFNKLVPSEEGNLYGSGDIRALGRMMMEKSLPMASNELLGSLFPCFFLFFLFSMLFPLYNIQLLDEGSALRSVMQMRNLHQMLLSASQRRQNGCSVRLGYFLHH